MRAVLDTNVFLSALLRGRTTRLLLPALIARRFHLLASETLVAELADVVIREAATFVTPTRRVTVCRDPEDSALLECALAGRADCLVTGDRDLLILHPFHGIRILRPAEFPRLLA